MIPPQIVLLDFARFNNAIRGRKILPAASIFSHSPYYLRMVFTLNPFVIKKRSWKGRCLLYVKINYQFSGACFCSK